jgi:quercetin dioxygenase-like cupin family protein
MCLRRSVNREDQALFVLNNQPVEYNFGGSRARLLVSGEDTDGAYCMLELYSPGGRTTPMHRHQHDDETLFMLDGELDVIIDGTTQRVRAGSTLMLPRGTGHQIVNRSAQTAHYLVICAPAGFDRFVKACAEGLPVSAEPDLPTDEDKARMRAAAIKFGITLIAPPAAA